MPTTQNPGGDYEAQKALVVEYLGNNGGTATRQELWDALDAAGLGEKKQIALMAMGSEGAILSANIFADGQFINQWTLEGES